MSKGAYIGVEGLARKVKDIYIGVDGVARKVKKGYVGVDGVARLCMDFAEPTPAGAIYTLGNLPYAAYGIAVAAFEQYGYFYFFGGRKTDNSYTNETGVGDIATGRCDTMWPSLPVEDANKAYAVVGTKVYLFGGSNSNAIDVFDDETLLMSSCTGAWVPTSSTAVAIGAKVYLFGGMHKGTWYYSDAISVFNTEDETITTLDTKLPVGASSIASAVIGKKVYLFGGVTGDETTKINTRLDTISVFNTEDETITTLDTKLPVGASLIAAAAVGKKVYLFGGKLDSPIDGPNVLGYYSYALNTINAFNTEDETITTLDLRIPYRYGISALTIGKKIYLFGGKSERKNDTGTTLSSCSNEIGVFDPDGSAES